MFAFYHKPSSYKEKPTSTLVSEFVSEMERKSKHYKIIAEQTQKLFGGEPPSDGEVRSGMGAYYVAQRQLVKDIVDKGTSRGFSKDELVEATIPFGYDEFYIQRKLLREMALHLSQKPEDIDGATAKFGFERKTVVEIVIL
jgi:hypothetical protein